MQNAYSIGRGTDPLLRICGELDVAFVPFFAVAGSGRGSGPVAEPSQLLAIAARRDASPAQVRLAWTLQQGRHVLAIPGTGSVAHLEDNVAAAALRLTAEELTTLASVPEAPTSTAS